MRTSRNLCIAFYYRVLSMIIDRDASISENILYLISYNFIVFEIKNITFQIITFRMMLTQTKFNQLYKCMRLFYVFRKSNVF